MAGSLRILILVAILKRKRKLLEGASGGEEAYEIAMRWKKCETGCDIGRIPLAYG